MKQPHFLLWIPVKDLLYQRNKVNKRKTARCDIVCENMVHWPGLLLAVIITLFCSFSIFPSSFCLSVLSSFFLSPLSLQLKNCGNIYYTTDHENPDVYNKVVPLAVVFKGVVLASNKVTQIKGVLT